MGKHITIDGNEAAASVAHRLSEVCAIYPITPSSNMGEFADEWSAKGKKNIWGLVPTVAEMEHEGGAAGAVHGALVTGSLSTTFTCSQGLLLMVPNMFKLAGELTPTVFHVSARAVATHALSIFGDHSDVMSCRTTGWAMLVAQNVQECADMAAVAHAATLETRLPFIHFFDGFRTSHEVAKMVLPGDEELRSLLDADLIRAHRARALNPDRPTIKGTAMNPDVFFQAREACNPFYANAGGIVKKYLDKYAALTGRAYQVVEYVGHPQAERVIIAMGSGSETVSETARFLAAQGEKVAAINIRLYRPFPAEELVAALPASVKSLAVLDRTKEPGGVGEPLFMDVVTTLSQAGRSIPTIGGRYGLSSKEFNPGQVKAVYDELAKPQPKRNFVVGINEDVTHSSLSYDAAYNIEPTETVRCVFYGLGADGTVGANKNSIKIIGEETDNFAQGYFVYDSKKSGSMTTSHLRFGPTAIKAPYLIGKDQAQFVACHNFAFLPRYDVLKLAAPGAVFLLNAPYSADEVWAHLPRELQQTIIAKKLRFYTIDANKVAKATGMGGRINTVMQTCFFAISGVLPADQAIAEIKDSIKKTYGKRGDAVVQQNFEAVDQSLANLFEVKVPATVTSTINRIPPVPADAPAFVRDVLGVMIANDGDSLPTSALPIDGCFATGTTKYEKRGLTDEAPVWDPEVCIQCGKCSFVCPHGVIRQKVVTDESLLTKAPAGFKTAKSSFKEFPGRFTIQVSIEDCTGCALCVEVCPAKNKTAVGRKALNMEDVADPALRQRETANWNHFLTLPEADRTKVNAGMVKSNQLLQPLFEFSGACAGCGETPYVKLLTQLFGDRAVIANATGCSSIYGGNMPTTPYTTDANGRGPAWANSLFEDNAEFGLGYRLSLDTQKDQLRNDLPKLAGLVGDTLITELLGADQKTEAGIATQRVRVAELKRKLAGSSDNLAKNVLAISDVLVDRTVWIVGGDGWAYDIGYGGLDHVLASGRKVRVLVLDTEVYSNTGGQASKSTPRAAVAKFAAKGKDLPKKDLPLMAMAYGYVYVAKVAMGANDAQTVKAFLEAEAHDGPSIILAYSHCIAHGIDMRKGLEQQKAAVNCGHWPLFRYVPALAEQGKSPLCIDSKDPTIPFEQYAYAEARYRMLKQSDAPRADLLLGKARTDVRSRWELYRQMAAFHTGTPPAADA